MGEMKIVARVHVCYMLPLVSFNGESMLNLLLSNEIHSVR